MKIEQQMELEEARKILEEKKAKDHAKRLEEFKHYKTNSEEEVRNSSELLKDKLKNMIFDKRRDIE